MADKTLVTWHEHRVQRARGCVVWFTGLSGSGKSTLANHIDFQLNEMKAPSFLLDGDNVRHGLNASPELLEPDYGSPFAERFGLSFAADDRSENIRRIGCVADLFCSAGLITLTAFVSPYRKDRQLVRDTVLRSGGEGDFVEVFVDTPLEICESRDPKGLYQKARAGEITGFTGIDDPYEPPEHPEVHLSSGSESVEESAGQVIEYLKNLGKLG
ncbi:MAG: adenylyl-sulfate kinase [Mariniblastus sp.]|nr:adenylyl-sulfate kinase [Mariniblastus sp.]